MMASETETRRRLPVVAPWPPDDSEESVVGTDLHQMTIINLRWGINEVAHARTAPGAVPPWQALSQTIVCGLERPDGTAYKTLPDVFVYHQPIDQQRGSVTIAEDGAPVLLIEVLSEATHEWDLDLERGKGYSYARAGVREYLALDPTGAFVPEGGRGWRLEAGVYRPWERDGAGRWVSEQIAVMIGLEGVMATVYAREGARQLREGEVTAEMARRAMDMERQAETIARQAAEIEELRRQIRRLRGGE